VNFLMKLSTQKIDFIVCGRVQKENIFIGIIPVEQLAILLWSNPQLEIQ